jgi:hypothetical protein
MFILERTSSASRQELLKTLSSFVQPLVPRRVAKPVKVVVESEHFASVALSSVLKLAVDFSMAIRYSMEAPPCAGSLTI